MCVCHQSRVLTFYRSLNNHTGTNRYRKLQDSVAQNTTCRSRLCLCSVLFIMVITILTTYRIARKRTHALGRFFELIFYTNSGTHSTPNGEIGKISARPFRRPTARRLRGVLSFVLYGTCFETEGSQYCYHHYYYCRLLLLAATCYYCCRLFSPRPATTIAVHPPTRPISRL